jgi:hypothetical protein
MPPHAHALKRVGRDVNLGGRHESGQLIGVKAAAKPNDSGVLLVRPARVDADVPAGKTT